MRVIKDFNELKSFLALRRDDSRDVSDVVNGIISDVRLNGDTAVIKYTEKFDKVRFGDAGEMKVMPEEIEEAYKKVAPELIEVIRRAANNIEDFHRHQTAESFIYEKAPGIKLGTLRKPLKTAGAYVPAGTAPLPSSVLMNVIPAKVAGVRKVIITTPPPINPAILVAADIAGADEIYKVGGAQAVAAMAFGTQTIPQADKITGPGNVFVATAKKLIYGQCNIDMVAGPSEILIIADKDAKAEYLAADMLSQAEHDKLASSILILTDESLLAGVVSELEQQLTGLLRQEIARESLDNYGAVMVVKNIDEAIDAANMIAPEHLELCINDAESYLDRIENAGAVFLGNYTPEPIGDYYAGPNHILPTNGTARFYSPLNVWDFIKQISVIKYDREALLRDADDVIAFAEAEGLGAHANSVKVRKELSGSVSHGARTKRTEELSGRVSHSARTKRTEERRS